MKVLKFVIEEVIQCYVNKRDRERYRERDKGRHKTDSLLLEKNTVVTSMYLSMISLMTYKTTNIQQVHLWLLSHKHNAFWLMRLFSMLTDKKKMSQCQDEVFSNTALNELACKWIWKILRHVRAVIVVTATGTQTHTPRSSSGEPCTAPSVNVSTFEVVRRWLQAIWGVWQLLRRLNVWEVKWCDVCEKQRVPVKGVGVAETD